MLNSFKSSDIKKNTDFSSINSSIYDDRNNKTQFIITNLKNFNKI